MHVSLDSALGRQRRLNQVGETISSIATPTAAYSLRSLTGGDPKVVRVRRGSDNHEQDFTASEVSSGALLDFVNAQVVAPLDIQALTTGTTNDGRNGDFLIAKAAYSLRSLGTRQATIPNDAAPLNADTVVPASGKYVVQVRRSSDDTIKSFTATEVTDGTLLSFVGTGWSDNGFVRTWYDQSVSDQAGNTPTGNHATQTNVANQPKIVNAGSLLTLSGKPTIKPDGTDDFLINEGAIWDTISNSALSCFTLTEKSSVTNKILWAIGSSSNEDGDWLIGGGGTAGDVQFRGGIVNSASSSIGTSGTVLLTALDVSGGDGFVNGTAISSPSSTTPNVTADRLVLFNRRGSSSSSTFTDQALSEVIFYGDDQTDNRTAIEANIGEHYSIDLPSGVDPGFDQVDGFVETWYDQSGNDDNAVQATSGSQPKIVDAGSSALIDAGSIDFDSSTSVSLASFTGGALSQPNTLFFVAQADNSDANQKIVAGATNTFIGTSTSSTGRYNIRAGGTIREGSTAVNTSQHLFSAFYNTTDELFLDGSGTAEISGDAGSSSLSSLFIGIRDNGTQGFDGKIKEVIVYNSDIGTTSATRTSLETNIKNHFGIS